MNAKKVAKLCAALSLKEKEGPLLALQSNLSKDGEQRLSLRLVSKILSNKLVNRDTFVNLMPRIWRIREEVEYFPSHSEVWRTGVRSFKGGCGDSTKPC
ncbi:hypothetical protein Dsin_015521 [Dipteronia sinensis]|uniref:Uncharacterized protein n=1 Tax=Dipteronia sinensis TaxID=43782 RepID=A0AAE0E541_9ROSI|nr:hypothetical protein Dsin_015521 [Dipteronia sinensis]